MPWEAALNRGIAVCLMLTAPAAVASVSPAAAAGGDMLQAMRSYDQRTIVVSFGDGSRASEVAGKDLDGYGVPIVSRDRRAVAWEVLQRIGGSYAVPIGVEVMVAHKPGRILYCPESGVPYHFNWHFVSGASHLAMDCGEEHGPPQAYFVLFNYRTGTVLEISRAVDENGDATPAAPAWARTAEP